MKCKLFLALLLVAAFTGCKDDSDDPIELEEPKEQYNCIFDSNVAEITNILNPTFHIFVDNAPVGVWPGNRIDSFYVGMEANYEGLTDTKVYLNLEPGEHSYEAYFYYGISLRPGYSLVQGKFTIPDTGSVSVLIDYNNVESDETTPFECGGVINPTIDIFRIGFGTITHPEGFTCVQNQGDCDTDFQL